MTLVNKCKSYYNRIMSLPDSPRKIASGVALGTALDFLPLPVISIPLGYLLAKILGFNPLATVLAVVSLKCVVPFFFALNYMVGRLLLGDDYPAPQLPDITEGVPVWLDQLQNLGVPFLMGSLINAALAGFLTYLAVRRLLDYRQRRREAARLRADRVKADDGGR